MSRLDASLNSEIQSEHSSVDASQAFRLELPFTHPSLDVTQPHADAPQPPTNVPESPDKLPQSPVDLPLPKADVPETPQDIRAADLICSLNDPHADRGRLMDKLRYTFVDEQNENGVLGMKELACRVSQGTGFYLSVDHFRSSMRVYALYMSDPNGYSTTEIPITGRGSMQYEDYRY